MILAILKTRKFPRSLYFLSLSFLTCSFKTARIAKVFNELQSPSLDHFISEFCMILCDMCDHFPSLRGTDLTQDAGELRVDVQPHYVALEIG